MAQTAFHYTSMESALAIFREKTLRFTYAMALNDRMEIEFGAEILCELIRDRPDLREFASGFTERRHKHPSLRGAHQHDAIDNQSQYVFCLSTKGDDVSQWRCYGDSGRGIAIEFDIDSLTECLPDVAAVEEVRYKREEAKEYLRSKLELAVADLPPELDEKHQTWREVKTLDLKQQRELFVSGKLVSLLGHCAFFKHEAFASECELRVVVSRNAQLPRPDKSLPAYFAVSTTRTTLKPFVAINWGGCPQAITSVTFGPLSNSPLNVEAMAAFLNSAGLQGVDVRASCAPYQV